MIRIMNYLSVAGILTAVAFSAALALADDHGGMMGGGMMGGDSGGGMAGRSIESCVQMMHGMHSGSQRPNEQWRQSQILDEVEMRPISN
jgi:hypothetical protein